MKYYGDGDENGLGMRGGRVQGIGEVWYRVRFGVEGSGGQWVVVVNGGPAS